MSDSARPRPLRAVVCLANGNLNGRVLRLVADAAHRTLDRPVQLITASRLSPLTRWPEERTSPYVLDPEVVDWSEAERRVSEAAAFILPPFWEGAARQLVAAAHRADVPVVCIVPDVGYGARKLAGLDDAALPDRVCVADPITRALLIENGLPATVIRETGSPYFDALLAEPPLPPAPEGALRVGLLVNPNGGRQRLANEKHVVPDGALPAVEHVLRAFPGSQLTVRLHPRQDPARIDELLRLSESAILDPIQPGSTLREFVAAQHVIVGSYSMGLMVARLLGRPALSYQPPMGDEGLRREVFAAWDVPVATGEHELAAMLVERLAAPVRPLAPESLLYAPGHSLDAMVTVIRDALSVGARSIPRFSGETA